MNDEQLKAIKRCIKWEKEQAEHMEGDNEENRQSIKEWFHKSGMEEFQKLGKPKNPNPPTKLTDKECCPECFFCHPELLQQADQDFNKN